MMIKDVESLNEAEIVQNPALGAALLWMFSLAYAKACDGPGVPMPVMFIVLPILLDEHTRDVASTTRTNSGLNKFSLKLLTKKEDLLSIHSRMLRLRMLTLKSLSLAIAKGLLEIEVSNALVRTKRTSRGHSFPDELNEFFKVANRLGGWCGRVQLTDIQTFLRVSF